MAGLNHAAPASRPCLLSALCCRHHADVPDKVPTEPPFIPDHELLRPIGHGAYGVVWLGRNAFGVWRAVKVVHRQGSDNERPFKRALDGIRRFEPISRTHAGFVQVLQVGPKEPADYFYYVMELADAVPSPEVASPEPVLEGTGEETERLAKAYRPRTLGSDLSQRGALPTQECLVLARSLAEALACLHANDLAHRDLKPANIIYDRGQAKLADIDLVVNVGEGQSFVGTEYYMAPEGPGTPRADLYSLGKVLYEASTGLSPERFPEVPASWANRSDRKLLHEFNELVMRACEANPVARYQTAEDFLGDLDWIRTGHSLRRLRWIFRAMKVAAVAVALGAVVAGAAHFQQQSLLSRIRNRMFIEQAQRIRLTEHKAGWSDEIWTNALGHLRAPAAEAVKEEALASLIGLDSRTSLVLSNISGGSAAFAEDGRLVVGGVDNSPALLLHSDGRHEALPVTGPGPVGFAADGTALQWIWMTNRLVLREAVSGLARREFLLAPVEPSQEPYSRMVLALSADTAWGAAAYSAGDMAHLVLCSAATGIMTHREDVPAATGLAFSPDASLLAVGMDRGATMVLIVPKLESVRPW